MSERDELLAADAILQMFDRSLHWPRPRGLLLDRVAPANDADLQTQRLILSLSGKLSHLDDA